MAQMTKDAKVGGNTTTVAQALVQGERNAEYRAKQPAAAVRMSFRFKLTGK